MPYIVMPYIVMPYIVTAYIVMAYIVVPYIVMAYIVMTYMVMAYRVRALYSHGLYRLAHLLYHIYKKARVDLSLRATGMGWYSGSFGHHVRIFCDCLSGSQETSIVENSHVEDEGESNP